MSYVDLNPTPASSDYTSIQARIQTYQAPTPEPNQDSSQTTQTPVKLIDFIGHEHKNQPEGIAFSFSDYMELVDWTGRAVRDDKTGAIAESLPPHFALYFFLIFPYKMCPPYAMVGQQG